MPAMFDVELWAGRACHEARGWFAVDPILLACGARFMDGLSRPSTFRRCLWAWWVVGCPETEAARGSTGPSETEEP